MPYAGGGGALVPSYTPGFHPGSVLLPPSELVKWDSLPPSVADQIFDGNTYDYYGKHGIAFDQDTMIDGPVGKAKIDYENWLKENPEIAEEIDASIRNQIAKIEAN